MKAALVYCLLLGLFLGGASLPDVKVERVDLDHDGIADGNMRTPFFSFTVLSTRGGVLSNFSCSRFPGILSRHLFGAEWRVYGVEEAQANMQSRDLEISEWGDGVVVRSLVPARYFELRSEAIIRKDVPAILYSITIRPNQTWQAQFFRVGNSRIQSPSDVIEFVDWTGQSYPAEINLGHRMQTPGWVAARLESGVFAVGVDVNGSRKIREIEFGVWWSKRGVEFKPLSPDLAFEVGESYSWRYVFVVADDLSELASLFHQLAPDTPYLFLDVAVERKCATKSTLSVRTKLRNPSDEMIQEVVVEGKLFTRMGALVSCSTKKTSILPESEKVVNLSLSTGDAGYKRLVVNASVGNQRLATKESWITVTDLAEGWQNREALRIRKKKHLFLAFYYPWYGTPTGPSRMWFHWRPENYFGATHIPAIGPYDSADPKVIRYHIRLAKSVGLDGFIVSWWGIDSFEDKNIPLILKVAEEEGFKITVYYEIQNNINLLKADIKYILDSYGSSPAFLKYEEKPVIFFYARVMGRFTLKQFSDAFYDLRRDGYHSFNIADGLKEEYLEAFDGFHIYNPIGIPIQKAETEYARAANIAKAERKIFAATVCPGYDDTIERQPGRVVDRQAGGYYKKWWRAARRSGADWVLVCSWNEWHEGTEIEPSLEMGDLYLNLTADEYARLEKRGDFSAVMLTSVAVLAAGILLAFRSLPRARVGETGRKPFESCGGQPAPELCKRCKFYTTKGREMYCIRYKRFITEGRRSSRTTEGGDRARQGSP